MLRVKFGINVNQPRRIAGIPGTRRSIGSAPRRRGRRAVRRRRCRRKTGERPQFPIGFGWPVPVKPRESPEGLLISAVIRVIWRPERQCPEAAKTPRNMDLVFRYGVR